MNGTHTTPDMWDIITFAIMMDSLLRKVNGREEMMMIYGMEKVVTQAAVVVNGMTHLTSANTSTTPHLRTWNLDSSQIIIMLMTIPLNYSSTVSLIEIFVKYNSNKQI